MPIHVVNKALVVICIKYGDIMDWKTVVFGINSTSGARKFDEAKSSEISRRPTSAIYPNTTIFHAIITVLHYKGNSSTLQR